MSHIRLVPFINELLSRRPMHIAIREDTELKDIVAKFADEGGAQEGVNYLKSRNIAARYTDGSTFGTQHKEEPGWGVFVHPENVKRAASLLDKSNVDGMEFDPFTQIH